MSQAITTKYVGPTEKKGSRIIATSGSGHRVIVNYDDSLSTEEAHVSAARALCAKLEWRGKLAMGGTQTGYVFVFIHPDDVIEV